MTEKVTSVTSATQWRSAQLVEFPSGNVAKLRKVSITAMLAFGHIPNTLLGVARQFTTKGVDVDEAVQDPERFGEFVKFTHFVALQAFVEPKVNLDPDAKLDDDEISILDLDDTDLLFVLHWTQGAIEKLKPFRQEPTGADS
jgi:hypothetical protein